DNEQISIAYDGQYVIPVKNDLSSEYDLDFEIERVPDGPKGQLKFVFLSEGRKVAETTWISRPRYRLAGLFLNKSNLEQWVRTSIKIWDNNELNSDQIITELTGVDLRARKVDWGDIWENQDTGYFDDWKVSFYTIDGKCSNLGIELARRMKYFED